MSTDPSTLSRDLHELATTLEANGLGGSSQLVQTAADYLNGLVCATPPAPAPAERTITINDTAVEAAAIRSCANARHDDVWKILTEDEREEFRADARNAFASAYAAQNPEGDSRG